MAATESDKPFVCNYPGCGQQFTNNDHLAIHKTKHELSLKLNKGDIQLIDQTPTPTRFLRNCEEAGLFQELEANPFEHDFKQATQNNEKEKAKLQIDGVQKVLPPAIPVAPPPSLANPQKAVPLATVPAHIGTATALTKQKLLASIQNKNVVEANQKKNTEVLAQALKAVIESNSESGSSSDGFAVPQDAPRRGRKPDDEDPETKRQKFLERNRAAASRCRARKKHWVDTLDKKAKELEMLNTSLQQEVILLRAEVQQLKSILLAHKDCPLMAKPDEPPVPAPSSGHTVGVTLLSSFSSLSPLVSSPLAGSNLLTSPLFLPSLTIAPNSNDISKSIEISTSELNPHQVE
ncbi:PREDICTED: cyclic AMP-dependent transcription factor ATF-2-like isoform X2 [Amphimedon queenslandica]|uniref:Cyclic AMP-dependent transcription factor ATF-2 n=1 Tax=Amphimedon queenslandica TaxID=400682 RepID=A0A1X7VCQ7_AMPQE|nr:PREDICTED: cyclic AMP-dependent transcription factor ATF-2-like isoform X2 [Amphimedon queenslandica]|eukprot:XP_019849658.1 PREDICTED: cyclic AMP-dependent transcription factor ATF-2-like isoform X2 [Amphimedon queenslandica]